MDLASALAATAAQARGAQQGSRARADGGASDAGAFGSVLSDAVEAAARSVRTPAAAPTPAARARRPAPSLAR